MDEASKAALDQPADIKAHYNSASVLKNRRVVFNIKGNDYRLFVGTHAEYNKVDAETVEME